MSSKVLDLSSVWQEATQKSYGLMGMADAYAVFFKEWKVTDKDDYLMVVMLNGINQSKVVSAIKKLLRFGSYYDLDKIVIVNDRDPNRDGSYVIAVYSEVEADSRNFNNNRYWKMLSRGDNEFRNGMTLTERLLLELIHFLATGKCLDVIRYTLCMGSHFKNGNMPYVECNPTLDKIIVFDFNPMTTYNSTMRSRFVVSCQLIPCGA